MRLVLDLLLYLLAEHVRQQESSTLAVVGGGDLTLIGCGLVVDGFRRLTSNTDNNTNNESSNNKQERTFGGEKDTNNKTAKTALRNAKEQNKVAKSAQPDSTRYTPEKGTGKRLRTDYYTNSDGKPIGIRKDNPRKYNDGGEQGSHYNAGPLKKKIKNMTEIQN